MARLVFLMPLPLVLRWRPRNKLLADKRGRRTQLGFFLRPPLQRNRIRLSLYSELHMPSTLAAVSQPSFPKHWRRFVKMALLHVVSLAQYALVYTRKVGLATALISECAWQPRPINTNKRSRYCASRHASRTPAWHAFRPASAHIICRPMLRHPGVGARAAGRSRKQPKSFK